MLLLVDHSKIVSSFSLLAELRPNQAYNSQNRRSLHELKGMIIVKTRMKKFSS